jgi:hypothetical protein
VCLGRLVARKTVAGLSRQVQGVGWFVMVWLAAGLIDQGAYCWSLSMLERLGLCLRCEAMCDVHLALLFSARHSYMVMPLVL